MRSRQLPPSVLLLFFLLLPKDTLATARPQYVTVVPSQLYAGVPEKACISLSHLNETVTLSVTLEYEIRHLKLIDHMAVAKDSFHCSSFVIPELPESSAYITVSIDGPSQHFIKRKPMRIMKVENPVFIQTDKPVYKPGQTVKFRIVSVDISFRPLNQMFPVVYIENPKRSRIFQWQTVTIRGGLGQLSFPLSVEPVLGLYKVVVMKDSGEKIEHHFEVNKYVLPKFEVQVKMPKKLAFVAEMFEVSACGLYTYGKPVPGLVTINVCRKFLQYRSSCHGKHSQDICEEFSQQADSKGCFTQNVKTKVFQLRQQGYNMTIQVEAKIREEGTGLELTGHGSCEITTILSKLVFTKVDAHLRRGLPFFGQILLTDENDQPMPNKDIQVDVTGLVFRYTTDSQGLVNIAIDTSNFTFPFITFLVSYKMNGMCYDNWWLNEQHIQAHHSVTYIYSPSKCYVHLEPVFGTLTCGQTQEIRVHYILNEEILKGEKELTFYYLIKARGSISKSGTQVLSIEQGNMIGVFSFSFQVEPDLAPEAQLVMYAILPNEEIIADTQKLDIEHCFANKVNLSFLSSQSLPAIDTNLKVTGTPISLCALRAVDQSMLIMKPEAELSPQTIYNLLPTKIPLGFQYENPENKDTENCISLEDIIHNGLLYSPRHDLRDTDVHSLFESIGLNILTNSKIRKPQFCDHLYFYGVPATHVSAFQQNSGGIGVVGGIGGVGGMGGVGGIGAVPLAGMGYQWREDVRVTEVRETVRKYFPETWIWDLVVLNSSGVHELEVKVPDAITEWKVNALCLSGTMGLGLSPTISLQVFQSLFLELSLPFSIVRGEAFILKATVFNYMSHCLPIRVLLEDSSSFLMEPAENNEESHCVCGNGRKTVSWTVTPTSLGKINFTATAEVLDFTGLCGNEVKVPILMHKDTVIRSLIVEPEGIEREETFSALLCSPDAEDMEVPLRIPLNVVEGSARATYSVLGDILGPALHNLENLLQMPYGCGEQNMALFVPNIYVLGYLNETQQMTREIQVKARHYLVSGYQRQLNYKHNDGSYSTFGDYDGSAEGNTWLTAFVLKAFAQAQSFIFVDKSHIVDALTWLSQKQKENGCFQTSGSLFNNAIKGGVDDEVTLSAYVTIALLEMPLPVTHIVVRNALFCLEAAWESISKTEGNHVYTKALLAYAFALAGNQIRKDELFASLHRDMVKEEDSIYWQRPGNVQEARTLYGQPRAPSVEVEMTSYVLLAYLTPQPSPSSMELSVASSIVKWLIKQQNSHGGFSSTQDTVVALQALAKYGAATCAENKGITVVSVKSQEDFVEKFYIDDTNRLLLQEVRLPEIPGNYITSVLGTRCAHIQISLRFNILPKKEWKGLFDLQVHTLPKSHDDENVHRKFDIYINISYTGKRPTTNMVIVDVKMVSGFMPRDPSVRKLVSKLSQIPEDQPYIRRTETNKDHVLLYIENVTNKTTSFSFEVKEYSRVENLKPATVKAYDYYETDELAIKEYSAPFTSGKI